MPSRRIHLDQDLQSVLSIVGAAVGGAAVGVERQWSGHASGPGARFAGVRTFTLLGGLAGVVGWLWRVGWAAPATVLLAGATGLVVAAYVGASRHDADGTTEVAALVVLAAGVIAGAGRLALASGIVAVTWLLLVEKSRLHALVARVDDAEMRAAARFAVMAVVILPLIPAGPFGPFGGIMPRELWMLVLLFSGLSFAGWVARRLAGADRGYALTGLLGGLVSSTGVTLTFARLSRGHHRLATPLALGVLAACTVMLVRVVIATAILNLALAAALVPYLVGPFAVGVLSLVGGRGATRGAAPVESPSNPLEFWSAVQLAALFQVVLFAVTLARAWLGDLGLFLSAAILGLVDVDALTVSMVKSVGAGVAPEHAALAMALGVLSNTIAKLAVALVLGEARFRRLVPAGLAAMAAAGGISIAVLR